VFFECRIPGFDGFILFLLAVMLLDSVEALFVLLLRGWRDEEDVRQR